MGNATKLRRGRSVGILLALTVLVVLAWGGAALASSSGYPDDSSLIPDQSVSLGSSGWGQPLVLVVRDQDPWGFTADLDALDQVRMGYIGITSAQLASVDLSPFRAILIPSQQNPAYKANVLANLGKISSFVANGGWLIAHLAGYYAEPWTSSPLPGGIGVPVQNASIQDLSICLPRHHMAFGLDNDDLDGWNSSAHGYFSGLPDSARVVYRSAAEHYPVYVTYPWGKGQVLATMMTLEWLHADPLVLMNELKWVKAQLTIEARRLGHTR